MTSKPNQRRGQESPQGSATPGLPSHPMAGGVGQVETGRWVALLILQWQTALKQGWRASWCPKAAV